MRLRMQTLSFGGLAAPVVADADTLLLAGWRHRQSWVGWTVARRVIIGRQVRMRGADGGACGSEASKMMMGPLGVQRSALQRKMQARIQRRAGGAIM